MVTNAEIAGRFEEFADLLEADEVQYKPRAYRRAAENIHAHPRPIAEYVTSDNEEAMDEIDGVGDAISSKIVEYVEEGAISREDGEDLAESIIGIDRALNALESLGPTELEREQQAKAAADTKRWMNFLKKALGDDDGPAGRRGR